MTMTIGADPELLVIDANGVIVPGIGLIGGTKSNPRPVKCGAVQEDNVLAEFNIDPCTSAQQFCETISTVTNELDLILEQHGLKTICQSSHHFDRDVLLNAGAKAMEFGCDPDINCWDQKENLPPNPYTELRTAGGHVHVGYDNPTEERSFEVACILDYLLGVSSVLLDDDTERREMYGQSGACRIKPYGVEYRVLSNFWLGSEELKKWVFDTTKLVENLNLKDFEGIATYEELEATINDSDTTSAWQIVMRMLDTIPGFYIPTSYMPTFY